MTTRLIAIIGAAVATVVIMCVLGRLADGKSGSGEKKGENRQ